MTLVFLDHRGTRRYFTGPHGGLSPNREHAARLTAEVAEKWRATFHGAYIGTVGVEPAGAVLGGPVDTEVTADRAQEDRDDARRDRYFSQRRRDGGGE